MLLLHSSRSADVHVGRELVRRCLLGALAGRTRVLVTHHLHLLAAADSVLQMSAGAGGAGATVGRVINPGRDRRQSWGSR